MDLYKLIPTHNALRNPERMWEIYQWSKSPNAKPVVINCADKKYYIQDGHHRLVAYYWLDRLALEPSEYTLSKYSRKEYKEVNFDKSWVTPFDLVEWVRIPDFGAFKNLALKVHDEAWIRNNQLMYAERRRVSILRDLASEYAPETIVREKVVTPSELALGLPEADVYAFVRLKHTNMTVGGVCARNNTIITSRMGGKNSTFDLCMHRAINVIEGLR